MRWALILLLAGCVPDESVPRPEGDPDVFDAEILPILRGACAEACHDDLDRPLALIPGDPRATQRRVEGFLVDVEDPLDSLLLLKPLDPELGGIEHEGGVQFEDCENHACRAIYAWALDAL